MTSHRTQRGPNHKANLITDLSKMTKSRLIPLQKTRDSSSSFPAPIPASSSTVPPLSGSTLLKRKASTSAPSSPTTLRPPRKQSTSARFLPNPGLKNLLTLRPANPPLFPLAVAGESNLSLGSASDRSVSVSSRSTDSLASGGSKARASGARARRDVADARRVLRTIKQVKERTYEVKKGVPGGKYLIHRTLHYSGYKLLREVELNKPENQKVLEFVNGDKFRFDYTRRPYKGGKQFVIHMPSAFHEAMAGEFNNMIIGWLTNIANGSLCRLDNSKELTMKIASNVKSTLATRVKYNEPRDDQLEPDLSFTCKGCRVADLVVEVAWSQSNLKLPNRATRFIEGKKGAIRTVVGLNMNDIYRGGRRATFSVWKAQQDGDQWSRTTVVDSMEFIDGNGQAIDDCELPLSLNDFICAKKASKLEDFEDVPLHIPSTKLYEFYKYAFTKQIMDEASEEIDKIKKKANDALGKILSTEKVMQDQGKRDALNRIVMGRKELADLRAMILEAEGKICEIKSMMEDVEMKMDKVSDREEDMEEVEEDRAEVEGKVAELETKLAKVRAEEENIVEADERSRRSRVRSALGLSSKD